jgi:hypothetical protein
LVARSPVFGCRELPRDRPLSVGRTDTHVVLRAGSWSLFLELQKESRYPDVTRVVPEPRGVVARLQLDPEDAAFLVPALERLPGAEVLNAPATLDLNGRVAVRSRGEGQDRVTELVLARSGYHGTALRIHINRGFLARAVRLGFTELALTTASDPIVCRDGRRIYAWQPLSAEAALEAGTDPVRIDSTSRPTGTETGREPVHTSREPMSERTYETQMPSSGRAMSGHHDLHETPGTNGTEASNATTPTGLAALIQEAEALHETLGVARRQTGRLIVALRRHRKQERLVSATLASLRQLKLQEAAP